MLQELTAARLREIIDYDPATGEFWWKIVRPGRGTKGNRCGRITRKGYLEICVDRGHYYAHRLAWLYMTGGWPPNEIDHANMVKDDNRWANLRAATPRENQGNKGLQRNNTSGAKGVVWHAKAGKWAAHIAQGRRCIHLGLFPTVGEAAAAYAQAAAAAFGEFARPAVAAA